MGAPQLRQATTGTDPYAQRRFQEEVARWLQCRATPEERARYTRYFALVQEASTAAARQRAALEAQQLGTARSAASSGGASGGSTARSRRAPLWSDIPEAATAGALETAARRARLVSAPACAAAARLGTGATRAAAAAAAARPESAAAASWLHTATLGAGRGGATRSLNQRPSTASAAPPDAATPAAPPRPAASAGLRLPLGAATAAAAAAAAEPPRLSATAALSARAAAAAAAPPAPKMGPLDITSSAASYGLKDLYPDLWANTLPICRPEAAPNKNFVSDWGESLRKGAEETWAPFLSSSYTVANAQVHKPTDDFRVRQQRALASWVAKQRTYCEGLLTPAATDGVVALLGQLPGPQKTELVELLRQLSAVVQPESSKPVSHELHCPQYSVEDAETTRLLKEQTRIKTMGAPRKVEVKGFKHTAHTQPAAAAAAVDPAGSAGDAGTEQAPEATGAAAATAAAPRRRPSAAKGAAKASDLVETLSSKCPLKWACAELYPATSSYTSAFGSHPSRTAQMHRVVFPEVNAGWGHVDEVRYPQSSAVYPIPQRFVEPRRTLGEAPSDADAKTTNRLSYRPRGHAAMLRAVAGARDQIEASRAARHVSHIPLSKAGVQAAPQWATSYGSEFKDQPADLTANRAMAEAVSAMFNGPTISFGKIAGMRATAKTKAGGATAGGSSGGGAGVTVGA